MNGTAYSLPYASCVDCTFREEVCPSCGGEISEDEFDPDDSGEFVPFIFCVEGSNGMCLCRPAYRNQRQPEPLSDDP